MNLIPRPALGATPIAFALTLALAVGASAQVASLTSPDESPDPETPAAMLDFEDQDDAILAYADCLREHGIEVDDPQAGATGARAIFGGGPDSDGPTIDRRSEEFIAANETCGVILEAARPDIDPEEEQERLEEQLALAQCIRGGGYEQYPDPAIGSDGRLERIRGQGFVVVVAVIGAVFVGANLPIFTSDDTANAAATPIVPVSTASVQQRTMESTEEFDGTLGYAGEGVIMSGMNGTYTDLPDAGDILTLGAEIYEVDGTNTSYLMYGNRPAYRALDIDSDNGPDIKQLETSLAAIGFPNVLGANFEPDWNFRAKTETAIEKWQKRTNQEQDGRIEMGEVTFMPQDVRITEVVPELGSRSQAGQVLAYTSGTDLVVTLDLQADRREILSEGDQVSVELPDNTEAAGAVTEISSVAQTLQGASEPTVEVTIELEDTAVVGDLDGAEVTVSVVRETRPDVLTVPVDALLALREGGYAIEMVADDGSTYLVAAEVGLFDDFGVEVSGNFGAGDQVVVPA